MDVFQPLKIITKVNKVSFPIAPNGNQYVIFSYVFMHDEGTPYDAESKYAF